MKKLTSILIGMTFLFSANFSLAGDVQLYHDKAGWQDWWIETFDLDSNNSYEITPFADTSSFQATVRQSLRADPPGLFTWWAGYRMKDMVDAGLVEDLSPIWDKYIAAGQVSPDLAKAFQFDGKTYAVPSLIAFWPMYYNKLVYAELGLNEPKTWEELESNFEKIKASGRTPVGQTIEGRWPAFIWFEEFLIRSDPDFYEDLVEGRAKYTDPQVEEAFLTWKSWMDKGWMDDGSAAFGFTTGDSMNNSFSKGEVVHMLVGTWFASTVTGGGIKEGDEWGYFVLPNKKASLPPSVIFEAGPIMVAKNAKDKDAALDAIDFWMSEAASAKWTELMFFPPHNLNAALPGGEVGELVKEINEGGYRQINRYWEATPTEICEAAVDEISKFVLDPTSYKDVMENLQTLADNYWSNN